MTVQEIQEKLYELRDPDYVDYIAKCVPTIEKAQIIGVRSPAFKKFFNQYKKRDDAMDFLKEELPHAFYEENILHGSLIGQIKDYDACITELDRFLPYVDNWAVCDGIAPKCFEKEKKRVWEKVREWVRTESTYTIRFGIKTLLGFLNDADFSEEQLDLVASVQSEEYYVKMMIAWYFATALTFQYERTVPYIENHVLGNWEHRKTIQKAVESFRISEERKTYLKTFRTVNECTT